MENSNSLDILVIEDDEDICDNLQDILELDDHRVRLAITGTEVLQMDDLESVNVVLLDWQLPDTTALQLYPKLKERASAADIIVVTGHGDLESAVIALRQGAVDYLLKPINPATLRASLQRIGRRQQLEREKLRSERAFQQLVETVPSAIVILRSEGKIAYFSSFAEQLTGVSATEVIGNNFLDLFLPEEARVEFVEQLQQTLIDESKRGFTSPLLGHDQQLRTMVWNLQLMEDYEGSPGVLAVGQDITDYRNAMDRLIHSERLAAIGEAMTGLIHESRNALARCRANLRRLARRLDGQAKLLEFVYAAQLAQEDVGRKFEEVREYAAPLKLSFRPVSLQELIEEAWEQLDAAREGRDAELKVNMDAPPVVCNVDANLMTDAIRNLLENSLTAAAGKCVIDVDFGPENGENCGMTILTIRDHGPGFSSEAIEKAMKAFFTTKTHCTGLGLAIVNRIVETHGGSISIANVEPNNGTGAVVKLLLPRTSVENLKS